MRQIVITGATSSIGLALITRCIEENIKVLAIVNRGSRHISRIPDSALITIVEAGLDDYASLDPAMFPHEECYDALIHLAWASTAGDAARNMLQPQAQNIKYALDAVDLAQRLHCAAFIGAGSQAEYGRKEEDLTEETIPNPETGYGIAKLCAGQLTRIACTQKGMRHIWVRILSAYGLYCQPQTVLNYTITELLEGRRPSLSGGDQIWDFIYLGDVARALLLLVEKGHDQEIYVIGSGHAEPLKNYLRRVRDMIDPELELGLGDRPYGPGTVMHLSCDISKLKRDTGFEPEVSFEDGVKAVIAQKLAEQE